MSCHIRATEDDGPKLSDAVFERVAWMARDIAGLRIPVSKRAFVQSRLSRRLAALGLPTYEAYIHALTRQTEAGEPRLFIEALTTNVSNFFREPHHFEHLTREVLPGILERKERGDTIRIWSAGCSAGQEPYSIAAALLETDNHTLTRNTRVLATDIDRGVLARSRLGVYPESAAESLGQPQRELLFHQPSRSGGELAIRREIRDVVTFRELNLMHAWPFRHRFDAIFCRNVVIYFDDATQAALWPRFADALEQAGALYLGHSERISETTSIGMKPLGITTYGHDGDAERRSLRDQRGGATDGSS